jgi:hypothetical protein
MTAPTLSAPSRSFRAAHAREEIFVAAGKPDYFVRKDRPDDDELVVVEEPAVHAHLDIHCEQPA